MDGTPVVRQDLARRSANRIGQLEQLIRHHRLVLPTIVAIATFSVLAQWLFDAPAFAWVTAATLAMAALSLGEIAVWLSLAAAVAHAVVDAVEGSVWLGTPALRTGGMVLAALSGAGVGVMLRRYEETRRRSVEEDAITGLLNVRAFYDRLHQLRDAGKSYAILIADIAGMRNINERYGHPTGTEAMRALGHVLRRSTKQADLVARLGSDEVAVALVGADRDGAVAAARRLSALLGDEIVSLPDGRTFRVHAYYGIATSADVADEVQLLRAADHAKHAAKLHGPDEIGMAADAEESNFLIFHPVGPPMVGNRIAPATG